MLLYRIAKDENIVDISVCIVPYYVLEYVCHYPLEGGGRVCVPHHHNVANECTKGTRESRFPYVFEFDSYLFEGVT